MTAFERALRLHMPDTPDDAISPNSGVYWNPKLEAVDGVSVPRTEFCRLWMADDDEVGFNDIGLRWDTGEVESAIDEVGGYPAFVRTAFTSGKHDFERASKITGEEDIDATIGRLVHEPVRKMIPVGCVMVREWINLDVRYTGFRDATPIAPEARAFIESGDVVCIHSYWPKEAIRNADRDDWSRIHDEMEAIIAAERNTVERLAGRVATEFEKYDRVEAWSVDFARDNDGEWWAIDMAHAGTSHHPDDCRHEKRWPDPRE